MVSNFLFMDHGSDRLLVWFGGRDEPFLSDKMCHATGCDVLSIKNVRGDWFIGGLVGIDGGLEGMTTWLGEQIKRKPYRKVFFAGQSSGGYAALKFAHTYKPHAVIVFNPSTQNWPAGSKAVCPTRVWGKDKIITNLNELYRDQPVTFPIVYSVGRSEKDHYVKWHWNDIEHAKYFKDMDNVTYIQHPFDTHVLTVALAKKGMFYSFVAAFTTLYS